MALVIITSAPLGLLIGTVAGTYGGWTDRIFMRITDVFLAVPKLLLALAFVAALGPGIINAALAITLTAWPPYARLARAEALIVRNADYVSAMRLAGASELRIVLRHIAPMCLSSVIVRMTFDMAGIILTAAGLGFLGLGAQPPMPEWGAMIAAGRAYVLDQWWVAAAPGAAIFIVSLAFNLLGDGLREKLVFVGGAGTGLLITDPGSCRWRWRSGASGSAQPWRWFQLSRNASQSAMPTFSGGLGLMAFSRP